MQVHWSSVGKNVVVVLTLAFQFTSAVFLPASTLLLQPERVVPTLSGIPPEITGCATLESRNAQANTICGYWSGNGSS
jgi:hypothetical protein